MSGLMRVSQDTFWDDTTTRKHKILLLLNKCVKI